MRVGLLICNIVGRLAGRCQTFSFNTDNSSFTQTIYTSKFSNATVIKQMFHTYSNMRNTRRKSPYKRVEIPRKFNISRLSIYAV